MVKIVHQSFENNEEAINYYKGLVDGASVKFRKQLFTDLPGQSDVYQKKRQNAEDYLNGEDVDYSWVESQALAQFDNNDDESMQKAAIFIIKKVDDFDYFGPKSEELRIKAKLKIENETSIQSMWKHYVNYVSNINSLEQEMLSRTITNP